MTKTKPRSGKGRRRWGPFHWATLGAIGLVLAAGIAFAVAAGDGQGPEIAEGPMAPAIALPTFAGDTIALSDFRGQPLVVNYFASWCPPCLSEMPGFEQVYQRYKGNVAFLGINLTDDPNYGEAVVEYTGITYPVVRDEDGSSFTAFGAFGMPTTVFISPDGRILELYTGLLEADRLEDRVVKYFDA
jgi:cytochrome c biogenesis protein CcmG/thiol:disulfide interchange protein DsbE